MRKHESNFDFGFAFCVLGLCLSLGERKIDRKSESAPNATKRYIIPKKKKKSPPSTADACQIKDD